MIKSIREPAKKLWLLWPRLTVLALALLVFGATAQPAYAHGFGGRYDLPIPLLLYLLGAGAAVTLSFVVIGWFVRGTPGLHGYPRLNLLRWRIGRFLAHPTTQFPLKLASVLLFGLVMVAGLIGDQDPNHNLVPTMVWIIGWVGTAYVSAFLGDVWALINPWKVTFGWAEALWRRFDPEGSLSLEQPYPRRWGAWPGVLLFLGFAWVELVYPGRAWPLDLAMMMIVYSAMTWAGMLLFGKHPWLRNGEAFSLAFGFLARFSPTEVRVVAPEVCRACPVECLDEERACINCYACFERAKDEAREWNLRPFGAGLLLHQEVGPSFMAFVLLMLASVTFDGFTATPLWTELASGGYSALTEIGVDGLVAGPLVETAGLLAFPLVFLAVYWMVAELMAAFAGTPIPVTLLARAFVYSLIPIALAYHLAHYFSYILIQGQLIIPLASDPLGFGWDLFGTAGYRLNIGIVGARFAWITAVVAIVTGHIIAVYVAHVIALRVFEERTAALRSQYAMLGLMVTYTMVSLWILAQPITEFKP